MKKALKDLSVNELLEELAKKRPLFHNERDFQFEIAQLIKEKYKCAIRLEYYYGDDENNKRCYIDLVAKTENYSIAFEFKYRTKKFRGDVNGETFNLKNQSARDLGCIYVHKDLYRLQELVKGNEDETKLKFDKGYVIFLTNDEKYKQGFRNGAKFSLEDKKSIKGTVSLDSENSYNFNGPYCVDWKDYSTYKTEKDKVYSLVLSV